LRWPLNTPEPQRQDNLPSEATLDRDTVSPEKLQAGLIPRPVRAKQAQPADGQTQVAFVGRPARRLSEHVLRRVNMLLQPAVWRDVAYDPALRVVDLTSAAG